MALLCILVSEYEGNPFVSVLDQHQWKKITFALDKNVSSKTALNEVKAYQKSFYWNVARHNQESNCNDYSGSKIIWMSSSRDLWLDCKPFSVLLKDVSPEEFNMSSLRKSIGFHKYQNEELSECFFLVNRLGDHELNCFKDDGSDKINFNGFQFHALYSNMSVADFQLSYHFLQELGRQFNFSIKFNHSELTEWGSTPNNSDYSNPSAYYGIVGEFLEGNYDFTAHLWYVTNKKLLTLDFLLPVMETYETMFYNKSLITKQSDMLFFIRPLNYWTWIVFVVFIHAMICIHLIVRQYLRIITTSQLEFLGTRNNSLKIPWFL